MFTVKKAPQLQNDTTCSLSNYDFENIFRMLESGQPVEILISHRNTNGTYTPRFSIQNKDLLNMTFQYKFGRNGLNVIGDFSNTDVFKSEGF